MLDVEFYRLYNGLWDRDLMPCLCRDFCDFKKNLPCFLPFFAVIFYCPQSLHITNKLENLAAIPKYAQNLKD